MLLEHTYFSKDYEPKNSLVKMDNSLDHIYLLQLCCTYYQSIIALPHVFRTLNRRVVKERRGNVLIPMNSNVLFVFVAVLLTVCSCFQEFVTAPSLLEHTCKSYRQRVAFSIRSIVGLKQIYICQGLALFYKYFVRVLQDFEPKSSVVKKEHSLDRRLNEDSCEELLSTNKSKMKVF